MLFIGKYSCVCCLYDMIWTGMLHKCHNPADLLQFLSISHQRPAFVACVCPLFSMYCHRVVTCIA